MIVFSNPGLIDLRCLRAFGVNVKPNSDNPIGSFGTGLKVAAAILLRLKCSITLYRGLDRYTFGTCEVTIRDKAFDFITLTHPDGSVEELAFNTHVGEHWEEWTPYRELHSNALDEGGQTVALPDGDYTPRAGETTIAVKGEAIERAHAMRAKIFLASTPFESTEHVEVHRGESDYGYYRGIRVTDLSHRSLFTYNLRSSLQGLTEDRTLKSSGDLDIRVGALISTSADEAFLEAALTAPENTYERSIHSYWAAQPSETFLKVYSALSHSGRIAELTPLATAAYLLKHKHLPIPTPIQLNRIQQTQLKRALAFCLQLGYPIADYPILTVPQERNGLMAWAQDSTIVLTVQCFDRGTKIVAQALIEEYLHCKHGFRDMTREFQTHLFQTIVTMGETIVGEPL